MVVAGDRARPVERGNVGERKDLPINGSGSPVRGLALLLEPPVQLGRMPFVLGLGRRPEERLQECVTALDNGSRSPGR